MPSLNISRRSFIKATALVAGGLVIAFSMPYAKRFLLPGADPATDSGADQAAPKLPEPNAFLRIGTDNSITVMLAHSEMAQSIWTTLPMLIAEVLDADGSKIKVEHAAATPTYLHSAYGIQITGGFTTNWSEFDRYRQAGAFSFGLGAMMHSEITFKDRQVRQSNFNNYKVMCFNEMAVVEVHIVPST